MPVAALISSLLVAIGGTAMTEVTPAQERAYEALIELGVTLNAPFDLNDVVTYEDPAIRWSIEHGFLVMDEASPPAGQNNEQAAASGLIWTMGREWLPDNIMELDPREQLAREPVFFSNDVALIDFECIEDDGSYVRLLGELMRLGEGIVAVSNARDSFASLEVRESGGGEAVLEFEFGGELRRWTMQLDFDWVDPLFFVRFDQLVEAADPTKRLYSFNDGGQSDLFFIASPSTAADLARLVGEPVRDWRSFRGEIQ